MFYTNQPLQYDSHMIYTNDSEILSNCIASPTKFLSEHNLRGIFRLVGFSLENTLFPSLLHTISNFANYKIIIYWNIQRLRERPK